VRGETHESNRPRQRDDACAILIALILLLAGLAASITPATAAEPEPRAIIIFDGSGSMWGRMGKQTKFDIARSELTAILPSYSKQIAMGLIAYGHRRKGDCNDIQILAAPAIGHARDLVDSIKSISPRGKTPIASSLESAATLLADKSTGHIIVLTDGIENCRTDLCETVGAIREASPGLTINVIGLGLRTRDIARIQCISTRGGGRLVVANSAGSLRTGLLDILDDIASGVSFAPKPEVTAQSPAIPPKVVLGPPRLQLRALHAASGPLIDAPVVWRVTPLETGASQAIFSREANGPDVVVPIGRYRVEARLGSATATREITVTGRGDRSIHLPLDVARLDIRMPSALTRGETITMLQTTSKGGRTVPPKLITRTSQSGERFYLPPGDYSIRRDTNATSETQTISLQAGDTSAVSFTLELATILVKARLTSDKSQLVPNVVYTVDRQTGSGVEAWSEIARSAAPAPAFTVPAGTYRVTAHTGLDAGLAKTEEIIEVQPGKTATVVLDLHAGIVLLNAVDLSGAGLPEPVRYRMTMIRSTTAPTSNPITTARSGAALTVPAGSYRIDAYAGESNLKATTEVVINAGVTERVDLAFNPARIKLSIAAPEGSSALRTTAWDILKATAHDNDEPVWSGVARAPEIALAPGRYVVIATRDGRNQRQEITLAPGQSRTVTLPVP